MIGIWGPRTRDVLASATRDDVSGKALPLPARARDRRRRRAVLAQRITFVGELGYELYVAPRACRSSLGLAVGGRRRARDTRRRLPRARVAADRKGPTLLRQRPHRGRHAGGGRRRLLNVASREGLHRCPALREERPQRHRLRTLVVGEGPGYLRLYGGEAVRAGGGGWSRALVRIRVLARAPSRSRRCRWRSTSVPGSRSRSSARPVTAVVAQDVRDDPAGAPSDWSRERREWRDGHG